ncbi:MAG: TauD/TfdA family dioxygenase [Magnetococcales bacterium]|nr:TauD/TfdA family dioxygenase [Magnetococcales bacterium]
MHQTSPFIPDHDAAYQRWKDEKLKGYPETLAALVVEIGDPFALTKGEKEKIRDLCTKANMALYRIPVTRTSATAHPLPAIMEQLGVRGLDHNLGAGPEGLSALSPGGSAHPPFSEYIPYRKAAIGWHTDGYYHPWDHQIRTLCLYCERPADQGGENDLWDHELAYIRLRDQNPDLIRTLMEPDIMTIPARMEQGAVARPERSGPVFSVHPVDGHLHMRYTHRTISIRWRPDATAQTAVGALRSLFNDPGPHLFRGRLEAGWGLISNNVLHTRDAFHDAEGGGKRILFRARYFERMPGK